MDVVNAPGGTSGGSGPGATGDDVASVDELGDETTSAPARGSHDPTTAAADGLDLRPRSAPVVHGTRRGGTARRWPWLVVLGVLAVAIAVVVSHAINDATLFYLNVDEAVAKQADLGTKPFRLQGSVVKGSKQATPDGVDFRITFNGATVPVHHVGAPPQLFQECIPVVLDGHWTGTGPDATFASNNILVKHSENYEAANPDRLKQAEEGGGDTSPACLEARAATP